MNARSQSTSWDTKRLQNTRRHVQMITVYSSVTNAVVGAYFAELSVKCQSDKTNCYGVMGCLNLVGTLVSNAYDLMLFCVC